jgi:hypothetical protein
MKTIAFDEAGYTGQDLANKDQPVYTLCSVNLSNEESLLLLKLISTQADEVKFQKLKKYPRFRKELELLLNHELINDRTVCIATAHKEYLIIAHTVDKLIEPLAYKDGIDIYKSGFNRYLTNMYYYCIPVFCNLNVIDDYFQAFINMFRKKEKDDIEYFYGVALQLIESCRSEQLKSTLSLILESYNIIDDILFGTDKYFLDVTATSFTLLCDYWGKTLDESFYVIADDSKPIKHYEWIFNKIKSKEISERNIGYNERTLQVPLKIENLKFENSKKYHQIQIADIIAGSISYYGKSLTRHGKNDILSKMIEKSNISNLLLYPIWPDKNISANTSIKDPVGNNAVDELTKIIFNSDKQNFK